MKQLVELPKKRITYKKGPNGTKYVYYTLRSYRNDKGKPTSDEKSIGKLDPETGMLIPNKNYFDLFPEETVSSLESVKSVHTVGFMAAYHRLAQGLGLTPMLQKAFPHQWEMILNLSAYMMANGNVMMDFEDWTIEQDIQTEKSFSSQRVSEFFASIKDKQRLDFLDVWCQKAKENEYIAYDVTSISSYSQQNDYVEFGYNRDGDKLAQFNLGVFYGEKSRLPLYYSIYNGSLIDKTYLPYMFELTRQLQFREVSFVMDQGFFTMSNLRLVTEKGFKVLSLLPKNYTLYKEQINEQLSIPFSSKEFSRTEQIYGRTIPVSNSEIPLNIHIYYDPARANLEEKALYDDIDRQEKQLTLLAKNRQLKSSQKKYFKVIESGEKTIEFEIDYESIDAIKSKFGYFMLVTSDLEQTAEEAIRIYRQKDIIEKSFDNLKNGMDYRRMRTHHTQTTEGKMFVAFIGLVLRSELSYRIKQHPETEGLRIKQVIRELNKIRKLWTGDCQAIVPLTKVQKQILTALDVTIG